VCLDGDALLVAAWRSVAEERRAEAGDLDGDGRLRQLEVAGQLQTVVLLVLPARDLRVDELPLDELALRVAAHAQQLLAPGLQQRHGFEWERAPGQVAARDDQIGLLTLHLGEHRLERNGVAVDVCERGDPHDARCGR
jgi:hypothetical protein